MAVVTIVCQDPVEMYWKMVFYGAVVPDLKDMTISRDEETGFPLLRFDQK